ncbi:methyltransferase [Sneathiella sp. P13V-1]|uniref:tRNA1(Val) (adenine(37)-N6)-methyltransferase n=1 Tax=Sneathiella sp. P13V-1 TaxID=2697366 RepID=UPI00187B45E8|nr:methyltransferase [Sneathiella sp. P13V-1]MBE7637899.1 methyltransferase [Sneathiella sp. P13V-1]
MEWTNDKFLDGKIQIRQPKKGFRAGSDAVLLAASVNRSAKVSVLDVGTGVGTVGICIKHRMPKASIYGIECQKVLADQALENARANNCAEDFHILNVDIGDRTAFNGMEGPNDRPFLNDVFDHVVTNPPFYADGKAQSSPDQIKATAHVEGAVDLESWLKFCVARLKPRGQISVIHRTDRLTDILKTLESQCGRLTVIPLWPNKETPAKRVIVQGVKEDKSGNIILPGLVLHEKNGQPTEISERILREGIGLEDIYK